MKTDKEKLDHVLSELKRVAFPDKITQQKAYWNMVEVEVDNAVDAICDHDIFVKQLIEYIENEEA